MQQRDPVRRSLVRGLLALLVMPLGKFDVFAQSRRPMPPGAKPAMLTVPLDEWAGLQITYKGMVIDLPSKIIYELLSQGNVRELDNRWGSTHVGVADGDYFVAELHR